MLLLFVSAVIVAGCYLCDFAVLRGVADRVFRRRGTADALRILAVAIEQREALPAVFYRLSREYPSAVVRRKLEPVAANVMDGADWQESICRARIVTPAESALLRAAERAGNLPWALRQIANRRERSVIYRLASAVQVLYPLVILVLGAFVAFIVISLFIPLVTVIHDLAR